MAMRWRMAWILVLALLAGPASALGLGQIQVRSGYGEPFLAEIPIVSSDREELRQLQARLASPETFTRIGLEQPQGLVSQLQFSLALDARGQPVIRVTSAAPVEQPLLTFLVEVDWGAGRLVREYSALMDAPDTVAAPAQPPIQAPQPVVEAPQGLIERPQEDAGAGSGATAGADEAGNEDASTDASAEAASGPAEDTSASAMPPSAPAPARTALSVPGEYGPVQAGDTLSQIVQRVASDNGVSANQMMIALLRANPDAFIGGNINLIRQGAVLRLPPADEAGRISAAEATAEVRAQVARWREMVTPVAQPAVAGDGTADDAAPAPDAAAESATADARLEIVPPSADGGEQAGTRSGINAGGEGEMLRQELQQAQETLAARDGEIEELKARLAEVEQLQKQQLQLIEMKDSELAAAQARLAEVNADPGTQAGTSSGAGWPWIGGGIVLLVLGLAAWLWSRRSQPTSARSFRAAPPASPAVPARPAGPTSPPAGGPTWHGGGQGMAAAVANARASVPDADADAEAEAEAEAAPEAETAGTASQPAEPLPDAGAGAAAGAASAVGGKDGAGPADAPAAGADEALQERLELARAYIDLGDETTARELLQEVIAGGDQVQREEAGQLLRSLA